MYDVRRALFAACACAALAACNNSASGAMPALQAARMQGTSASGVIDLPEPPVVRAIHGVARAALTAQINPATGQPEFVYDGMGGVAPTFDIVPGQTIEVDVIDNLPSVPPPAGIGSDAGMSRNGTADDINLHFHGLTVSPKPPGDDVIGMLAEPGQSLHYEVHVPRNQQPGLYWYHPHVYGFTSFQVGQAGMSGAIVIEGLERHYRGLASLKHRVMIVRATGLGGDAIPDSGSNTHPCGTKDGLTVSINGIPQPNIVMAPGERQFFRVVNATGHKTLKLAVDGGRLEVLAIDGFALDTYPGNPPIERVASVIVPPAARAEFIVTGPASGSTKFRTLCFDTGPDGDPDPPLVLANIVSPKGDVAVGRSRDVSAVHALPPNAFGGSLPPPAARRTVVFSENAKHFLINGTVYKMHAPPMFVVHVGTVEEWHVLNVSREVHDFHIHQTHFLVERIDGVVQQHPIWRDSVVVPHERGKAGPGAVTLLMDFRDPIIRGEFMFHCHILDHEDAGMMANIRAI
jgi:FtsP/CotA-like multicopper oxidase with cupredoxin domain